jgi:hypothetical protein
MSGELPEAANTPSITRTSSFTYNSDGLLKSETIAPNTDKSACYCAFGFVAKTVVFISGGKRFVSIWAYGFTFQKSVAIIGKA